MSIKIEVGRKELEDNCGYALAAVIESARRGGYVMEADEFFTFWLDDYGDVQVSPDSAFMLWLELKDPPPIVIEINPNEYGVMECRTSVSQDGEPDYDYNTETVHIVDSIIEGLDRLERRSLMGRRVHEAMIRLKDDENLQFFANTEPYMYIPGAEMLE